MQSIYWRWRDLGVIFSIRSLLYGTCVLFVTLSPNRSAWAQGSFALESGPAPDTRQSQKKGGETNSSRGGAASSITLTVVDSSRMSVIRAIAAQAQIQVSYDAEHPLLKQKISFRVSNAPVLEALSNALAGTGLKAIAMPDGKTIVLGNEKTRQAAAVGTILGKVTDSVSGKGISGAFVTVVGTQLSASTQDNGSFRIAKVPVGARSLSVKLLGYRTGTLSVTVDSGGISTVNIVLKAMATSLTEVVTTATGDRRRLEVGNAIATIQADSIVKNTLIRNVSDLLTARAPSVVVSNTSGLVGAPSKIRIRGVNSAVLNNDPIIILDGVRLQSQVSSSQVQADIGASRGLRARSGPLLQLTPSRLDDIDPSIIESIDVLRGPSASSLYGTEAANGVIVIKTKRGRSGPLRGTLSADHRTSNPVAPLPLVFGWGRGSQTAFPITKKCRIVGDDRGNPNVADGTCVLDSVTVFGAARDAQMTTLSRSSSGAVRGSISGGSDILQQFFSVSVSKEMGPSKMSQAEERRLQRQWGYQPPQWMRRPNQRHGVSGASSTTFRPTSNSEVSANLTGSHAKTASAGTGLVGVGGSVSAILGEPTSLADTLSYFSAEEMRNRATTAARRATAAFTGNVRPGSWLTLDGSFGGDYGLENQNVLVRDRDCTLPVPSSCPLSERDAIKSETFEVSGRGLATVAFKPFSWLATSTSIGEQYSKTQSSSLRVHNASGTKLGFGTDLFSPNPVQILGGDEIFEVEEARDGTATAGWYVEHTLSVLEQLFLTGGFRQDAASAFGETISKESPPTYPKLSASWALSNIGAFQSIPWITLLRVRTAYGHSGQQARKSDVLNSYKQTQWIDGGTLNNAIVMPKLGNPDLRPERVTEFEHGLDLSLLPNERVQINLTRYRKRSKDAIVRIILPPSYGLADEYGGAALGDQLQNVGSVRTWGSEVTLSARLIDTDRLRWSSTVNVGTRQQKLVSRSQESFSWLTSFRVGYPLFGYFGRRILSYADANQDGYLSWNEVAFSKDTVYFGTNDPRRDLSYSTHVDLWNGTINLSANLRHEIGTVTHRASPGLYDKNATLARQAAELEAIANSNAYYKAADYLRLNEIAMNYNLSKTAIPRILHVRTVSVGLSGQNLGLWTNYSGKDPNVSGGLRDYYPPGDNGAILAQPRNWNIRINLGL